jgi:hypothetical protein
MRIRSRLPLIVADRAGELPRGENLSGSGNSQCLRKKRPPTEAVGGGGNEIPPMDSHRGLGRQRRYIAFNVEDIL